MYVKKLSRKRLFKIKEKVPSRKACACFFFLTLPAESMYFLVYPQIRKSSNPQRSFPKPSLLWGLLFVTLEQILELTSHHLCQKIKINIYATWGDRIRQHPQKEKLNHRVAVPTAVVTCAFAGSGSSQLSPAAHLTSPEPSPRWDGSLDLATLDLLASLWRIRSSRMMPALDAFMRLWHTLPWPLHSFLTYKTGTM